jgi:hypothetical protein
MKVLSAISSPAQDDVVEKILRAGRLPCYEYAGFPGYKWRRCGRRDDSPVQI